MSGHGIEAGHAYVSVVPETSGFNKALSKEVQQSGSLFDALGGRASNILKGAAAATAAAAAAAVTGIAMLTKGAVDAYARNEQLVGGIETLYGRSSDKLIQYAQRAYKTAGVSANDYMDMATSFAGSLLQSLGGDTEKAAGYADKAIRDMSDNANKMGTDMGMIQNAYQGFAKQNYTMLDNLKLGYGGTKTEMERLLQDAEKIAGKKFDLSSYADIIEAIHVIQEQMGITGTTAEEAEETITGSVNAMKSAWDNWLVAIAGGTGDVTETTDALVDSVITAAENIIPRVGVVLDTLGTEIVNRLPELAQKLGDGILDIFPEVVGESVRESMGQAFDFMEPIIESITEDLIPALDVLGDGFIDLLESLEPVIEMVQSTVGPVVQDIVLKVLDLVSTLSTQIGPALEDISELIDIFLPVWQEKFELVTGAIKLATETAWPIIVNIINSAVGTISSAISLALSVIKGDWSGAWNACKSLASNIWDGIVGVTNIGASKVRGKVASAMENVKENMSSAWSSAKSAASSAWEGIKSAVSSGIDSVVSKVSGFPDTIKGFFSDCGSWLVDSGASMIQGFLDGLNSIDVSGSIRGVLSKIRDYFPFSPAKKGPFSGRGWVYYSGQSVMNAMAEGALSRAGVVTSTFSGIMGDANSALTAGYTPIGRAQKGRSLADEIRSLHNDLGNIIYMNTPLESDRSFNRRVSANA